MGAARAQRSRRDGHLLKFVVRESFRFEIGAHARLIHISGNTVSCDWHERISALRRLSRLVSERVNVEFGRTVNESVRSV